jgi:hypothetical protein
MILNNATALYKNPATDRLILRLFWMGDKTDKNMKL